MRFRARVSDAAGIKYRLNQDSLFKEMAKLDPMWDLKPTHRELVFKAGDARDLCNQEVVARSTKAREELEVEHANLVDSWMF